MLPKDICDYFNTKQSTVSDKARKIREMCNLRHFDKEFSTNQNNESFVLDENSGFILPESMVDSSNDSFLSLFSQIIGLNEDEVEEILVESFLETTDEKELGSYLDLLSMPIPEENIEDYLGMIFNIISGLDLENEESYSLETIEDCEKFINDFHEKVGDEYFKENKGYFWQIYETREFMMALLNLSILLFEDNQDNKAIEQLEYILELNPNDNQGVRYLLISNLLKLNLLEKAEDLINFFDEEESTIWNFSKLLLAIKNNEDEHILKSLYKKAVLSNKYVVPFLLGDAKISGDDLSYYSEGSEEEAIFYLGFALDVWGDDKTAMKFLNDFE